MLKRTGNWELYKTAHNCYNKEKRKAKQTLRGTTVRRLWMYLTGPDSRGSWTVSWPTGWGSIKLSDGQYTQTGKSTIEEIYNLHSLSGKGVCSQGGDRLR